MEGIMAKRTHRFTTEFSIIITMLIITINVCVGVVLMNRSKDAIKVLMHTTMLNISNSAADMIDGDVLEKLTAQDVGTPEYQKIYDTLKVFYDNIELEYVYCIMDNGNGNFSFSVDPAPDDPGEFGAPVVYTDALYAASKGIPSVDEVAYTDAWGRFYSAYSPVFNSNGKVAGIVATDFSADWYDSKIRMQVYLILSGTVISIILGITFFMLSSWRMKNHLNDMTLELSEVAGNVDELANELNVSSVSKNYFNTATYDIQVLGERIHMVKEGLKKYTENLHSQANSMISALSSDFYGVYCINLDKNEGVCYLTNSHLSHGHKQDEHFTYTESMLSYANTYVTEKYREDFINFLSPEAIRQKLEKEKASTYLYMINRNGQEIYEMVRLAAMNREEVCMGFSDVDEDTRRALQQTKTLSDALKSAEGANRAKTAFLSNMSHEIRTPMNAIIGLYRLALNEPDLPDTIRDYFEKIGTSAEHLLNVINEILDMSRIESGKMILRQESFSMTKLLEQINVMIGSQCENKNLEWEWHLSDSVKEFYIGDDMKLKEVLINILSNAVKFTPNGGKVLFTIDIIRHYDGKSVFVFTVKDTGIGMSSDYLPKLFDPFSLEDFSTKTKYGSTGLGMSITKNIVDMMNGDIKVESEKNVGTTFVVTLTLDDCTEYEQNDESSVKNATVADLRGRHILIAEDVEINAEIIKMILDVRGVETVIAGNGKIAVEKFASSAPGYYDAILMDIRMPEMDGLEATRAIREMDREDADTVPIIALTANAFYEDVQRSLQSGLNAHLSKPVEPESLFETLENLICSK